ncbi:MAG TPA: helix-turn-helix transcriptional regulator [Chloroflexota bacterium]|jgi:transcriptional regulator with XRE-family HTH domain
MQRHPIERRRHALGLRQQDLAEKMGVSPQTVRNWEAGKGPYGTRIPALARVLEVEPLALRDELDEWIGAARVDRVTGKAKRRRRVDPPGLV